MSSGSIIASPLDVTIQARRRLSSEPPLDAGYPGAHCDDRSPPLTVYIASSDWRNVPLNNAARRIRASPSDVPSQR